MGLRRLVAKAWQYLNGEFVPTYWVRTYSGRTVSEDTAMRCTTVMACAKLIAEVGAMLPIAVVRRVGDRRIAEDDHPLRRLLDEEPNEEMSSFDFRLQQWMSLALWGNSYAHKLRNGSGRLVGLYPIDPSLVAVRREQGLVVYDILEVDGRRQYTQREIFHVRTYARDGIVGLSPIRQMREAIGFSLAAEEYGARFFANGARPDVYLEIPARLSEKAREQIIDSWRAHHAGERVHNIAILEGGMKVGYVSMPHDDMQFLETRKFQRTEIMSWYRVPPWMISDVERSTSFGRGIEQQAIGFMQFTMSPWIVAWEKAIRQQLLDEDDKRRGITIKHNTSAILRGDFLSRMQGFRSAVQAGILSPNEIRALEDREPFAGGDRHYMQMQMVPVDTVSETVEA